MRLILGSGSPRRLELLAQIGVVPDEVRPPEIDETPIKGEVPHVYCKRIAWEKACASEIAPDEIVLCADTTVGVGRRILGKPDDENQAEDFLRLLSGRSHSVTTALVVKNTQKMIARHVTTKVRMKRLSDEEIRYYIGSGDWRGKAGGYAIQGPAGAFIPAISGSFSAVMGLPVHEAAMMLQGIGYKWGTP